jgi:hypothetical protein
MDPNIWAECLHERAQFFPEGHAYGHGEFVHCVMLAFALVLTDVSCRDSDREIMFIFNVRHLQHWMSGGGRTILCVKEVLPSGLLLLEGKDGRKCREHSKNCAPCHLPIEGTVHPELAVVPEGLSYLMCGEKK